MAAAASYEDHLYTKETGNKGKGLFSPVAFKEGDIILEEKPLVACQFSWNRQYHYTVCDNCMKSLETAQNMARRLTAKYNLELPYNGICCEMSKNQKRIVKCPKCQIPFCSKECFQEAEDTYHQVICVDRNDISHPINKLESTWKETHYPPETTSIMLIVRMVAMVIQSSDPEALVAKFNNFFNQIESEGSKMTHKLLGNQYQERLKALYQLLKEAIHSEHFNKISTLDGIKSLFGLIGMNGQGIGTSSLSQYVHSCDNLKLNDDERQFVDCIIDTIYDDIEKESGQFLNCEGSGLYQLQSSCNHSCTPNAEVTFPYNSSTLVLVALSDIAPHEEISLCYLDECQRSRSRHSRKKILRENYLFECSCTQCEAEADQPSETSSGEESGDEMDNDE